MLSYTNSESDVLGSLEVEVLKDFIEKKCEFIVYFVTKKQRKIHS